MAIVSPFCGIRYNVEKISRLHDVITPPYDVISPDEREVLRARSPYNFVHIDLPVLKPDESVQPYQKAAELFFEWLNKGVMIRDNVPCFYYYELSFKKPSDSTTFIRRGFVAILRIEEFGKGCVYPHEKTFSRVRADRLQLMRACKAQLSPVFALYSDPKKNVISELTTAKENSPVLHFTDDGDMEHKLWRVTDEQVHRRVVEMLRPKDIFVADGHHRYETALAYRNEMRQKMGARSTGNEPYEYCLMYLSPMEDPGLTILPTHRMFTSFPTERHKEFLTKAREFFDIEAVSFEKATELENYLCKCRNQGIIAIGHAIQGQNRVYLLRGRTNRVKQFMELKGVRPQFHDIDVVILDSLVFGELYQLPENMINDEKVITFVHDIHKALDGIMNGRYEAGFFINPTTIEQVRRVALAGLTMPHKATYFYPKVVSGLVLYDMSGNESIA